MIWSTNQFGIKKTKAGASGVEMGLKVLHAQTPLGASLGSPVGTVGKPWGKVVLKDSFSPDVLSGLR